MRLLSGRFDVWRVGRSATSHESTGLREELDKSCPRCQRIRSERPLWGRFALVGHKDSDAPKLLSAEPYDRYRPGADILKEGDTGEQYATELVKATYFNKYPRSA